MADLSQTAAEVTAKSNVGQIKIRQGGEAITQGNAVYLKPSDSKYYKADVTTSEETARAAGIALTPCDGADDYFVLALPGTDVDLGATLTVGETYVVSVSGAIAPIGDLASGDYVTTLGIALTASKLRIDINASGVQVP